MNQRSPSASTAEFFNKIGAKRSLADSFTIVSVASIKMVLGPAPHIRKLHLLDSVARDLQRFWQNGNIHKFGTPICKGFGKPRE
jgi:hypothetical protein